MRELDSQKDPICFFLDSQLKSILLEISQIGNIQLNTKSVAEQNSFALQLEALYESRLESVFGNNCGAVERWKFINEKMSKYCQLLTGRILEFCRLVSVYDKPQKSADKSVDMIKQISDSLSHALRDLIQLSKNDTFDDYCSYCYYLPLIVAQLAQSVKQFSRAVKQQQTNSLDSYLTELRQWSVDVICQGMVKHSGDFYQHEDCKLQLSNNGETCETRIISLFGIFMKISLRALLTIGNIYSNSHNLSNTDILKVSISQSHIDLISDSLFKSMESLLDCIQYLAFNNNVSNYQLLISIVNLQSVKQTLFPLTIQLFERLFNQTFMPSVSAITLLITCTYNIL